MARPGKTIAVQYLDIYSFPFKFNLSVKHETICILLPKDRKQYL